MSKLTIIALTAAIALTSVMAHAEDKAPPVVNVKIQSQQGELAYGFSTEQEMQAKELAKQSLKTKTPVTAPVQVLDNGIIRQVQGASGPIAASPNTISAIAISSSPLAIRPSNSYRTLTEANKAGINPMASAPKIQSKPASAAEVAMPDLTDNSFMGKVKEKIGTIIIGLALIGVGVWLGLKRD